MLDCVISLKNVCGRLDVDICNDWGWVEFEMVGFFVNNFLVCYFFEMFSKNCKDWIWLEYKKSKLW